jgi:Sulfotransferase family
MVTSENAVRRVNDQTGDRYRAAPFRPHGADAGPYPYGVKPGRYDEELSMSWGRGVTAPEKEELSLATPTVVYIAGSGRSGSTLLERIVGAVPGYANVGELLDLPRRVAPADEMCGCGQPFSQCPFWTAVGKRAVDGWTPGVLQDLHTRQHRAARQRYLPQLLTARSGSAFGQRVGAYVAAYRTVVAAVAAEADARYVVDASKWPAIALALHRGGLDVRVIHLVRDVRGVTHSLSRRDIERPHTTAEADVMYHNSPAGGAARWLATQTEVDLLRTRGVRVARLAYADLVTAPAPAVARALDQLGLDRPAGALDHVSGTTVELGPSHGLSGNPSRFRHGPTQLRPDNRWREQMRGRDRILATTIGLPQLIRLRSATQEDSRTSH